MYQIITKIRTLDNLILEATFADGEVVSFDIKTLLDKYPEFSDLKNKELFEKVKIDGIGYGISWNDKLDLSSDGIYSKGKHIGKVDPEIKIVVGQSIARAREEAGLSQRELATKSGVMQAEISKIELGKGNPTITTLQKIAKALGKSAKSFLI